VPAVDLFLDRVHAVRPDFALTEDNAGAVAEICRRLDGLPLALELAAARSRTLPVEQVAARLGDRFRLLTSGSRTALPRHRTLRAVVEWSWDLLSEAERDLVERLAAFPGGISPEAAAHVVTGTGQDPDDTEDLLAALVDKSLLQLHAGPRYRMLETIREYGVDRLAERGLLVEAREAHAAYFHELALQVEPRMRRHDQLEAIALTSLERDNLLRALQQLCDHGDADRAVGVALALAWLWSLRGEHAAAVTWLRRALAVPSRPSDLRDVATGLLAVNTVAVDGPAAAREVLQAHGGRLLEPPAPGDAPLLNLVRALVPAFLGLTGRTSEGVQQALDAGVTGWERAVLLMARAHEDENEGELTAMRESVRAAQEAFEEVGDRFGLAAALEGSARLLTFDGRLEEAVEHYERSGRLLAELGAVDDSGRSFFWVAQLRVRTGELDAADEAVAAARVRFEQTGSWMGLVLSDTAAAAVARERGDVGAALTLAAAAESRFLTGAEASRPPQLLAVCLVARALGHAAAGDPAVGLPVLARARAAALASGDMPVVALVAVAQGAVALAAGDGATAAELVGVADAVRGTADPTDPDVRRIVVATAALPGADERRAAAAALSRAEAVRLLERLAPGEQDDAPSPAAARAV
jgi:predicted ATPase